MAVVSPAALGAAVTNRTASATQPRRRTLGPNVADLRAAAGRRTATVAGAAPRASSPAAPVRNAALDAGMAQQRAAMWAYDAGAARQGASGGYMGWNQAPVMDPSAFAQRVPASTAYVPPNPASIAVQQQADARMAAQAAQERMAAEELSRQEAALRLARVQQTAPTMAASAMPSPAEYDAQMAIERAARHRAALAGGVGDGFSWSGY